MVYAEALERQVEALRWVSGVHFERDIRIWAERLWNEAGRDERASSQRWIDSMRGSLTRALDLGETYFWSDDLAPLILAGGSLPGSTRLRPEDLPSPYGFIWFEKPLYWGPLASEPPPVPPEADGVSPFNELTWALSWRSEPDLTPPTVVIHTWCGPADPDLQVWEPRLPFHALPQFSFWRFADDLASNGSYSEKDHSETEGVRLFATCMLFMAQEIVQAGAGEPVDRAARRRMEREGWQRPSLVRVIRLRRIHKQAPTADGAPEGDWSCRWVVRGHWRQQPCGPGQRERRTTWVLPHVKGPEDKPLKAPRATVFAVVR